VAHALLNVPRMNHKLLFALGLAALTPSTAAHADAVTDRVFLVTGGGGCPTGQMSFRRILQLPDGRSTQEQSEFTVPAGKYLEITSVEYTTPYHTQWASFFQQFLDVHIRQRNGSARASILNATFQNTTMFTDDENSKFINIGQYMSQGAVHQAVAFPVGPLMSSNGRLCVDVKKDFWTYGGTVRIRGRFIASGELPVEPPPGGGVLSP
jgi:hypothetical protein